MEYEEKEDLETVLREIYTTVFSRDKKEFVRQKGQNHQES